MALTRPQLMKEARALLDLQNRRADFVRLAFGAEPDPWQAEALDALDAGENVVIRSGHGVGKTTLLGWIVIHAVCCFYECKIPCTAPTQHQLSDLLWADIAKWLRLKKVDLPVTWTATKLGQVGREESWFAAARACSDPNNLAGFHAEKLIYVVDEAAGVPEPIFEVIDGALTTPGSQLVMAGNPTALSGAFHAAFHKNRRQFHTIKISSEDSPRVSPDYPANMAAKWGKDSDIYRVRVLGEFPLAESDSFIPLSLVEAAVTRYGDPGLDLGACEMGIDVARFGDDETVFAIRKGGRLLKLECHRGWSTTQTAARAMQFIREYKIQAVKVDDTGVGGGVTDQLADSDDLGGCNLYPMNFGGAGNDDYHNSVSVWYGLLKDMLKAKGLALPDDEELVAQLSTRKYKLTAQGRIIIENKPEMKKRGLPSPDRAEAVALAFAQARDEVGIIDLDSIPSPTKPVMTEEARQEYETALLVGDEGWS